MDFVVSPKFSQKRINLYKVQMSGFLLLVFEWRKLHLISEPSSVWLLGAFRPHNGNEHHSDQHQNGHQHRDSHLGQGMEGDETANKHKQTSKQSISQSIHPRTYVHDGMGWLGLGGLKRMEMDREMMKTVVREFGQKWLLALFDSRD